MSTYAEVGGWQPETLLDLMWCEEEEYVTPAGVTPDWAVRLREVAQARAEVHRFWWHHDARCTDPRCRQ